MTMIHIIWCTAVAHGGMFNADKHKSNGRMFKVHKHELFMIHIIWWTAVVHWGMFNVDININRAPAGCSSIPIGRSTHELSCTYTKKPTQYHAGRFYLEMHPCNLCVNFKAKVTSWRITSFFLKVIYIGSICSVPARPWSQACWMQNWCSTSFHVASRMGCYRNVYFEKPYN